MSNNKEIDLVKNIIRWGHGRVLICESSMPTQALKLVEEWGELVTAIEEEDIAEVIDAIGDIQVVTILLCQMANIDYNMALKSSQLKGFKGTIVHPMISTGLIAEGIAKSKDTMVFDGIIKMLRNLFSLCESYNINHVDALDSSYNIIKHRKGSTSSNGSFVKEEDIPAVKKDEDIPAVKKDDDIPAVKKDDDKIEEFRLFLNSIGYSIEKEDGLWCNDCIVDHSFKDILELFEQFYQSKSVGS